MDICIIAAKRSQFRLASTLHKGLIPPEVQIHNQTETGSRYNLLQQQILSTDIVTDAVTVKNTTYKTGMLIVLTVSSQDKITVGWVKKIVVRQSTPYFIVIPRVCIRARFRYFRTVDEPKDLVMRTYSEMSSYKPLLPRGTELTFVFFLHGKLLDDESD